MAASDTPLHDLARRRLLGWSIAARRLDPGADVGCDIDFAGGDMAVVEGRLCLEHDLALTLTTRLGSDPFNIGYGFDGLNALSEEADALMTRERIRISVIKVLKNDPRVRRILDVKLLDGRLQADNAADSVSATAVASTGVPRILDVRVAFEAISGDQSLLDTAKVKLDV